jgi:two-component system, cell cycle sensor histidine kinase and response regulator CckA
MKRFPARKMGPAAAKRKSGSTGTKRLETVLFVEDEEMMRTFLVQSLTESGYRVLVASDGEHALTLSEEFAGTIHLLITDIMMPLMNGKELADRLCALRPEIQVLFITGLSRSDIWPLDACENLVDWLPKPFTGKQFRDKVREMLDFAKRR